MPKFPKILTIIFLSFIIIQTGAFLFINLLYEPTLANTSLPKLQISIPDLHFSPASPCPAPNQNKTCYPWIGEYISGIYKYAIGIVGILAAVTLMIGGVIWLMAGGNASRVGEAKAWIGASLTGLIIALCSYMILYQINPSLTQFNPIGVTSIEKLDKTKPASDQCGGCSTNYECKKIDPAPGITMSGFNEYTCVNNLPGTCVYSLQATHKETEKKINETVNSNTSNEEECLNKLFSHYKNLINDPLLNKYTIKLIEYNYFPN